MKTVICGFELDVPPAENPFGDDYKYCRVVKETDKAYMVEIPVYHRTFGNKITFKWIGKKACKVDVNGDVFVPVWLT